MPVSWYPVRPESGRHLELFGFVTPGTPHPNVVYIVELYHGCIGMFFRYVIFGVFAFYLLTTDITAKQRIGITIPHGFTFYLG